MRKVDLSPYQVQVRDAAGQEKEEDYDVPGSLRTVLLHPQLQLTSDALLAHFDVVQKIEASDGTLLLEEAEYQIVMQALAQIRGFQGNDVPFVRRLKEAPEVEVEAKPEKIAAIPNLVHVGHSGEE
jgi:hypothetical protein